MENFSYHSPLREEYQQLKNYPEIFDTFKKIYSEISNKKLGSRGTFKLGNLNKDHIKLFLKDNLILKLKDEKDSYEFSDKGIEFSRLHLEERIRLHPKI